MTNEWTPFSLTSILWEESGRMVWPFSCQMRSGVGRPLTYVLKKQVKSNVFSIIYILSHIICAIKCQLQCNRPFKVFSNLKLVCMCLSLWRLYACGSHGKWVCAQCLRSVFNNSHSWETQHLPHLKLCQRQTTVECPCVFMFVYVCACVCVYTHGAERGGRRFIHLHLLWCSWEHTAQVPFPWVCIFPVWCLQCPSCISLQPTWVCSWLLLKEQAV